MILIVFVHFHTENLPLATNFYISQDIQTFLITYSQEIQVCIFNQYTMSASIYPSLS